MYLRKDDIYFKCPMKERERKRRQEGSTGDEKATKSENYVYATPLYKD